MKVRSEQRKAVQQLQHIHVQVVPLAVIFRENYWHYLVEVSLVQVIL
jgi:hypothetical protein